MSSHQFNQEKGFTLLEILATLGVLAVVSALAVAGFSHARQSARRLACRQNLHELALAFRQYETQHMGKFPRMGLDDQGWITGLSPHVSGRNLFVCLSDWRLATSPDGRADEDPSLPGFRFRTTSYRCFLSQRQETFPDGKVIWSIPTWVEIHKRRGSQTPILICRYHRPPLFARLDGSVDVVREGEWDKW